jgi:hypothetical protein
MGVLQPLPTGPKRPKPKPGITKPVKGNDGRVYMGGSRTFDETGRGNNAIGNIRNQIGDLSNQDRLYKTY